MSRSHYSVVQQKNVIIYAALSHINLIQTLKILTHENNYRQRHNRKVPVTYFYLYIKSWKNYGNLI